MGKILAKFEQLFTPPFLQSDDAPADKSHHRHYAEGQQELHELGAGETTEALGSSSTSLSCREFMGSLIARFKRHKEEARAAAVASAARRTLPFDHLPRICKMRVFAYLDMNQRGVAAKVKVSFFNIIKNTRQYFFTQIERWEFVLFI